MKLSKMKDNEKPGFSWDRNWDIGEIRKRLMLSEGIERISLMAWILREGTFTEIWNLLSPIEVYSHFKKILPFLGRRKEYWSYTFDAWHKLGKI